MYVFLSHIFSALILSLHFQFYIFEHATLYKNVNFLLREVLLEDLICKKIQDEILFKFYLILCITCFNVCVCVCSCVV